MDKKLVATAAAPAAIGPYTQAVRSGALVFTSGQLGLVPGSGLLAGDTLEEQARQALVNLAAVLTASGASLASVLKCTVFMKDLAGFPEFNRIYADFFKEQPPARSCVEVARLPKDALVEIEAVAVVNEASDT